MSNVDTKDSAEDKELEEQYEDLFDCIEDIVEDAPENVPELFAVILALPPFRDYLNRQELLAAAVVEAKKTVKEAEAEMTEQEVADAAVAGGRSVNLAQLMPKGPGRA